MKNHSKIFKHSITALCAGTIGLSGGAAIVLVKQNNAPLTSPNDVDNRIDLGTKGITLSTAFTQIPTESTLLRQFAFENSFSNTNDLEAFDIVAATKSFKVRTVNNSFYYKQDTVAVCSWNDEGVLDWTTITGQIIGCNVKVFEDNEVSRLEILQDLHKQFPTIDIEQLYIDAVVVNQDNKSAVVRTVEGSTIYENKSASIIAGYTKAIEFTYSNSTLTQTNNTSGTTTFKYHGASIATGVTYSCSQIAAPVSIVSTTGVVTLAKDTNFRGALYTIKASYTDLNNVLWEEYQQIYVQQHSNLSVWVCETIGRTATAYYNNCDDIGNTGGLHARTKDIKGTNVSVHGAITIRKSWNSSWSGGDGPNDGWWYVSDDASSVFNSGTDGAGIYGTNLMTGQSVVFSVFQQRIILQRPSTGGTYSNGDILYVTYTFSGKTYGMPIKTNPTPI